MAAHIMFVRAKETHLQIAEGMLASLSRVPLQHQLGLKLWVKKGLFLYRLHTQIMLVHQSSSVEVSCTKDTPFINWL